MQVDNTSQTHRDSTLYTDSLSPKGTWFYQAMLQLADTPSESLCVPMAHGGDPQFSFNVKMRGVEGTRGAIQYT